MNALCNNADKLHRKISNLQIYLKLSIKTVLRLMLPIFFKTNLLRCVFLPSFINSFGLSYEVSQNVLHLSDSTQKMHSFEIAKLKSSKCWKINKIIS